METQKRHPLSARMFTRRSEECRVAHCTQSSTLPAIARLLS